MKKEKKGKANQSERSSQGNSNYFYNRVESCRAE
jgi:hypothetical protein